jgi:serine/threonine protein kinase
MSQRAKSNTRNARGGSANAGKQGSRQQQQHHPQQQQQLRNVAPQNEVKKRVGNYVIGNTVGEGTFGKVKVAIHIPTGEKVAVKILEKKRIQEQADVRRVNREIKILKKARHGNIIQLFEVLDTPNSIYLIMENADGYVLIMYCLILLFVIDI